MATNPFDAIKFLNTAPDADIDVTDTVPVVEATDGQAYKITMGQLQSFVLNGGTIDPNFDDVTADTVTINSAGTALTVANGEVSVADKISHVGDANTAIRFPSNDTFTVESNGTEFFRVSSAENGATELITGTQYPFASEIDIGTDPNEIPLNQFLGTMAFQDAAAVNVGLLEISNSATTTAIEVVATSDTPTDNDPTTDAPSGFIKILVGGNARYIPFYA